MQECEFDEVTSKQISFYGSDLRGAAIEQLDILAINLKKAKLDLQQCINIAEDITEGKYVPQENK
ncbi:MAG: hypothetical protein RSG75_06110 [Cellulosilyticaceae bacterium]